MRSPPPLSPSGRVWRILLAAALLAATLALLAHRGRTLALRGLPLDGGDTGSVAPRDPQLTSTTPSSAPVPSPSPAPAFPKSPEQLARARVERDRMRERIYQAFGKPAPEEPAPSATGHAPYAPMPELDGGQIDPAYIRGVIHDDYFPLAQSCYLDLVNRAPDAGGRLSFDFTIVGNPQIGGIVERVDLADGSTIDDPAMVTCMRESMLSMTFAPPPNGGSVTVRYPIDFSPVDDDPRSDDGD